MDPVGIERQGRGIASHPAVGQVCLVLPGCAVFNVADVNHTIAGDGVGVVAAGIGVEGDRRRRRRRLINRETERLGLRGMARTIGLRDHDVVGAVAGQRDERFSADDEIATIDRVLPSQAFFEAVHGDGAVAGEIVAGGAGVGEQRQRCRHRSDSVERDGQAAGGRNVACQILLLHHDAVDIICG